MGVKSLWSLLTPVGRPAMLETMEGKTMAIDSSIWIYQFQATMRDKDGRVLVNAHVLGFLRRISKLLFYGIKPVFVFDGGAPALKRNTLRGRKEKKSGAAASHAKLAERLLAAQMRREALDQFDGNGNAQRKGKQAAAALDDRTVYLEDVESTLLKTPKKPAPKEPTSSSKKNKFYDHDPYRLPDVDMDEMVAQATKSSAPDPRLATEDELRAFIEEMRPEDFDVTSPAFRELPTEIQYEIVGDLRLKSRQTSYARLQKMLRNAPTALDFSKQQIENLRQRNTLTQQLLITTDSIGSAHISIPVRIASERNKQYVLVKNESASGGWILGVRDEGTQQKPIKIDMEDVKSEDSDEDMEEVTIPQPRADPDLQEFQRSMALSTIGSRIEQKSTGGSINRKYSRQAPVIHTPLFNEDEDDYEDDIYGQSNQLHENDGEDLAMAIQASYDDSKVRSARTEHRENAAKAQSAPIPPSSNTEKGADSSALQRQDAYPSTSRLDTVLTFANSRTPEKSSVFGRASLLSACNRATSPKVPQPVNPPTSVKHTFPRETSSEQTALREQAMPQDSQNVDGVPSSPAQDANKARIAPLPTTSDTNLHLSQENQLAIPPPLPSPTLLVPLQTLQHISEEAFDLNDGMEQVISTTTAGKVPSQSTLPTARSPKTHAITSDSDSDMEEVNVPLEAEHEAPSVPELSSGSIPEEPIQQQKSENENTALFAPTSDQEEPEILIPWSRSPSPSSGLIRMDPLTGRDAGEDMDHITEETDYAQFLSQVRGRDIEDVRRDIDEEIQELNAQRKAAMRDSEDVTQQMVNQIMAMLRLFGIPYITAPMEAEAQCAELVSLGLVDGVITDDSDVFLFGAQRVFKNMFNQSKTVECFLSSDLSRELGLDRDVLVNLAYLLGSDYVDGLTGVGPVVAMEILKEFPGENGLVGFRDWWVKVQKGKDAEKDTHTKFRKKFKSKFKDLFLTEEWPNPAVRDAYINPTVDSSDEPFKWGLPDLDALRVFFKNELGWNQGKVDEVLLPIIQKMNKRNQAAALNKQSNLNNFLDISGGSGTHAPKKRQAYTSKRLQDVVDDFRRKRGRVVDSEEAENEPANEPTQPKKRKKVLARSAKSRAGSSDAVKRKSSKKSKRRVSDEEDESSSQEEQPPPPDIPPDPAVVARLRPRPKPIARGRTQPRNDGDSESEA